MHALKIALSVLYNPASGFREIKRFRDKFSYVAPIVLLLLLIVMRIASMYITNYPIALQYNMLPQYSDLLAEVLNYILPLLVWVVGSYLVTTINGGECLFREVFSAAAYSFMPFIVFWVPLALFSRILSTTDSVIYGGINMILTVWVLLLFLINLSAMNSYGLLRTIGIAVVSLLACLFMLAILLLLYVLGDNLFTFISTVIYEYRYLIVTGG